MKIDQNNRGKLNGARQKNNNEFDWSKTKKKHERGIFFLSFSLQHRKIPSFTEKLNFFNNYINLKIMEKYHVYAPYFCHSTKKKSLHQIEYNDVKFGEKN